LDVQEFFVRPRQLLRLRGQRTLPFRQLAGARLQRLGLGSEELHFPVQFLRAHGHACLAPIMSSQIFLLVGLDRLELAAGVFLQPGPFDLKPIVGGLQARSVVQDRRRLRWSRQGLHDARGWCDSAPVATPASTVHDFFWDDIAGHFARQLAE
jgi:hypothetical protein